MKKYIYALDLSLNSTGVCVFTNDGEFLTALTIDTFSQKETQMKLKHIGEEFEKLMKIYPPEIAVIEQGFTLFNASTQAIFRVHGLVNYLFYKCKQIYYPATTVKKTVGGKGNMTKKDLKSIILRRFPAIKLENFDESDAFSVGLTYFQNNGIEVCILQETTCQEKLSGK